MIHIDSVSNAQNVNNEDFFFTYPVTDGHVLTVGDFARSNFVGLDKMAETELRNILSELTLKDSRIPPSVLLTQIVMQFNNRLLSYKQSYDTNFQCCVIVAAVVGRTLHFLPVGDCRLSVVRNEELWLLNGTMWRDASGHLLPPIINKRSKVKRGAEENPPQVLGYTPVAFSPSDVKKIPLEADDVLLLYSDGIDKVISPVELLKLSLEDFDQEAPGAIISRVMKEISMLHHDDDRTLLVATGPHELTQQELEEQQREKEVMNRLKLLDNWSEAASKFDTSISEVRQVMLGMQSSLDNIKERVNEEKNKSPVEALDNIEKRFQQIYRTDIDNITAETQERIEDSLGRLINQFTTTCKEVLRESIDESKQKTTSVIPEELEVRLGALISTELEKTRQLFIDEMLTRLHPDSLARTGAHGEADAIRQETPIDVHVADENAASTPESRLLGHNETTKMVEVPGVPGDSPAPASANYLIKLAPMSQFREGVIHIGETKNGADFYLVDESDVEPISSEANGKQSKRTILAVSDAAPAGWLAAVYHYLLLNSQDAPFGDVTGLETWVLEKANALSKEHQNLLGKGEGDYINLRNSHAQLRDKKGTMLKALFGWVMRDEERELARSFFSDTSKASPNSVDGGGQTNSGPPTTPSTKKGTKSFTLRRLLVYIGLILIVMAIPGFLIGFLRVGESRQQSSSVSSGAASTPTLTLAYGADGRTLFLVPEESKIKLPFRVQYGKEHDFKVGYANSQFGSEKQALEQIRRDAGDSIVPVSQQRLPDNLGTYRVTDDDLKPSGQADDPCLKFIKRVNDSIPTEGVHTHLDQLFFLNPNVRCSELRKDDPLIVYTQAVPK